ncbi:hypothetical protein G6O69_04460 [Pseudenhygromyxa sp. WMMC2535]|uniref:hypothetical protein n=1 Tax=Pseudenhygromyxa sp. WMMC2535 TaxID=2712867 RepID=UPI001552BE4A|nr:hypothetical protein [Pseudenhygromyxa sp. WMMC2535]NVB37071.1 hypothetical protein [Pseudenhygromyxa sp. WMMC2535]
MRRVGVIALGPLAKLAATLVATLALPGCWNREAVWEAQDAHRASVAREGESEAERLYRHGRDCMDTLERDDCAIDYFEQLVALEPDRRDLLGDATFRLVELYRRHEREEQATLLLRKFWELGMDRGSAGVVPYGTRFAPPTLTSMFMVDVDRLEASSLHAELPADAKDMMFTCDEARREQLREEVAARRAQRREQELAAMTPEAREASERDAAKRKARYEKQREARGDDERSSIYSEGFCQVAAALALTDTRDFQLFLGASHHEDARQSMGLVRVEGLEDKLGAAVTDGRLILEPTPEIPERNLDAMPQRMRDKLRLWTIAGVEYEGAKVQVMSFDRDELIVAPQALATELLVARAHDDDRLDPQLRKLLEQVPADVAFMSVITPDAMQDFMGRAGAMAKLLPDPEGLMIAAVVYDYAGLFVRVPTEDSVKGWLVLSIARRMLEEGDDEASADGGEGEDDEFMANLDISQAPDGKALLMSNILTRAAVLRMFMG